MKKEIKWGIIGCGKIAGKFASDLKVVPNTSLYAVASRNQEKANNFGKEFGATQCYNSYEKIMQDAEVDVIYIATPHTGHFENTMKCLEYGKAVLCEKPFAMKKEEVAQMIKKAQEKKVFLMEALWTRFIPSFLKVKELIDSGVIGDIKLIQADFGFKAPYLPEARLFNKTLGGGSLLDIGIYPIFLASTLLGKPSNIKATASIGDTGVDESCGMIFQYENGVLASLYSTIVAETATDALIYGDKGRIVIHGRWHEATKVTLYHSNQHWETFTFDKPGHGYNYEITAVSQYLRDGLLESPLMSFEDSLRLMELLDWVGEKAGIRY